MGHFHKPQLRLDLIFVNTFQTVFFLCIFFKTWYYVSVSGTNQGGFCKDFTVSEKIILFAPIVIILCEMFMTVTKVKNKMTYLH